MSTLHGLMEVILYVKDMAAQVAFYRDQLGLSVRTPPPEAGYERADWVEFETGACTLVLHSGGQPRPGADSPKLVFRVLDIRATVAELRGRSVTLGTLRSPAPDVWVSDGTDPEGNKFSIESNQPLAQPISTTHRVTTAGPYTGGRRAWTG